MELRGGLPQIVAALLVGIFCGHKTYNPYQLLLSDKSQLKSEMCGIGLVAKKKEPSFCLYGTKWWWLIYAKHAPLKTLMMNVKFATWTSHKLMYINYGTVGLLRGLGTFPFILLIA